MPPDEGKPGAAAVAAPPAEQSYRPPAETSEDSGAPPEQVDDKTAKTGEGDKATVVQKGGLKVAVPKPRSRFQERISDLVGERNRHETEARTLRERLAKYETPDGKPVNSGAVAGKTAAAATDTDAPLKPEDYETYGEYIEALVTRTIVNAGKKQRSQEGQDAAVKHRLERLDPFGGFLDRFAELCQARLSKSSVPKFLIALLILLLKEGR